MHSCLSLNPLGHCQPLQQCNNSRCGMCGIHAYAYTAILWGWSSFGVCILAKRTTHTHTPATVINFHLSCRRRKKRVDGYRKLAIHIKFKACWFSQMFARSQSFTLSLSYFSSPALHEPLESATTTECSRTHTHKTVYPAK